MTPGTTEAMKPRSDKATKSRHPAAADMPITAIAPWFGAKRNLAPRIVAELGKHRAYWEPFCGSMAVLLAKPESQQETACDLHGDLTNLAIVLKDESTAVELYGRLSRTMFCERLLAQAVHQLNAIGFADVQPSIERAYWFFVHSWCARNGTSGSKRMSFQLAVRFTPGGGSATTRFRNAIESIPAWHHRLRQVVVLNRDAFDVLPRIADEPGVAIYVDPPYLLSTRNGDGDGGYLHDFDEAPAPGSDGAALFGDAPTPASVDRHGRLAGELARFRRARVVVSYYAHPRLETLYPTSGGSWTHVACPQQKNMRRSMKADYDPAGEAEEMLIINGPGYSAAGPWK